MTLEKSKKALKADKAKRNAERALTEADELAQSSNIRDRRNARKLRRIAKRLHSKAERRSGRIVCNEY